MPDSLSSLNVNPGKRPGRKVSPPPLKKSSSPMSSPVIKGGEFEFIKAAII